MRKLVQSRCSLKLLFRLSGFTLALFPLAACNLAARCDATDTIRVDVAEEQFAVPIKHEPRFEGLVPADLVKKSAGSRLLYCQGSGDKPATAEGFYISGKSLQEYVPPFSELVTRVSISAPSSSAERQLEFATESVKYGPRGRVEVSGTLQSPARPFKAVCFRSGNEPVCSAKFGDESVAVSSIIKVSATNDGELVVRLNVVLHEIDSYVETLRSR